VQELAALCDRFKKTFSVRAARWFGTRQNLKDAKALTRGHEDAIRGFVDHVDGASLQKSGTFHTNYKDWVQAATEAPIQEFVELARDYMSGVIDQV
jgi:hypothetical protein